MFHVISLFPVGKVRVETDIYKRKSFKWDFEKWLSHCLEWWDTRAIFRVHTLLSSSKFHDFPWLFPWRFQVFQDLWFSCQFLTNLSNKTLIIIHDFQGLTIKFHDFPGLENEILKFHDFPGFPWPVQTLYLASLCKHCNHV